MGENNENYVTEKAFLNNVSKTYSDSTPYPKLKREYVIRTFMPYIEKFGSEDKSGLELGCSDGHETEMLAQAINRLDVLDGSSVFIEKLKKTNKHPNVRFIYSLFEEYKPIDGGNYDFVFCNYVLEHVMDVTPVLEMIKSVLKPNGLLFVTVPNSRAASRQLALKMGILKDLKELTENDHNHGHRRVYDWTSLGRDLEKSNFQSIQRGGIFFKILADFQFDRLIEDGILGKEHFEGLYKLGLEYPDFADSLFAVCSPITD